jgi:hypothetical protein
MNLQDFKYLVAVDDADSVAGSRFAGAAGDRSAAAGGRDDAVDPVGEPPRVSSPESAAGAGG